MQIKVKIAMLRQTRWYEYAIRFVLGGFATVITGVIAKSFGPQIGGLFLAFPAIFLASVTLVEKHERERKEKIGLPGRMRGKDAAALDAAGAALGSVSLGVFAIMIWLLARPLGIFSLLIALFLWIGTALSLWRFRRLLR